MSLYLIKGSTLEFLADAIRNKLGNGQAGDDSAGFIQTGSEIIHTESSQVILPSYNFHMNRTDVTQSQGTSTYWLSYSFCDSKANLTTLFGQTPRYIKYTLLQAPTITGATSAIYFDWGSDVQGNWNSNIQLVPNTFTYQLDLNKVKSADYNNKVYVYYMRVRTQGTLAGLDGTGPSWKVEFLDSSSQVLTPLGDNPQTRLSNINHTVETVPIVSFGSDEVVPIYTPVLLSLQDMADKIDDYLRASS